MILGEKLKALKTKAQSAGISESVLYLMKSIADLKDELEEYIDRRTCHIMCTSQRYTTVGGAATEVVAFKKASPDKTVYVSIEESGASPVSILSAKMEYGEVHITFSADPSSDHKINYMVIK